VPEGALILSSNHSLMIRYILKSRCSSPKSNIDVYLV
jgi:hypothetical protein